MIPELVGQQLVSVETKAHAVKIAEMTKLLGTDSAAETAKIALFFGVTITGDMTVPKKIGIDMNSALLGEHQVRWNRPFVPDEPLVVTVRLSNVFDKGNKTFAVVESTFATPHGEVVQTQATTFIQPKRG